jgi:hypothetical protein
MMKALFVYSNEAKTGLSAKAKKIEDGFREAGYDVDAIYFSSGNGKPARLYEWGKVNCLFICSILTARYDVVYVRYAYYFGLIYLIAWIMRCPLQIEVNSNIQGELVQRGQRLRAQCDRWVIWMACHVAKRVHVVSKQLERIYRSTYPAVDIVFNPNFVVSEEMPSSRNPGATGLTNLVFLGNAAQPWHGIERFIQRVIVGNQWFATHCRLHLVGQSTDRIDSLIVKHRLQEIVRVHGFLTGAAKAGILQQMDVGIGCFDLGVIGLTETTSIKNGEYLYSGLALLLGYEDPACPAYLSFVGKLLLDEEDVQSALEAYIRRIRALPDLRKQANDYARTHLLVKHYIDKIVAA